MSENPDSLVGICLKNKVEAEAVRAVCAALETVFEENGYELTDEEYMKLDGWTDVLDKASRALSIITSDNIISD